MSRNDFAIELPDGMFLEYYDDTHTYLVNGAEVPSITQILQTHFKTKYAGVDKITLENAAAKGTEVHEAIERYCQTGADDGSPELIGFKFLKKMYKFEVLNNEIPVVLYRDGLPVAAGRVDMLLEKDGVLGLADIKRTYSLDLDYLGYQLNLYRIAYQQTYGVDIGFLRGIHVRMYERSYRVINIDDVTAWQAVEEYEKEKE